MVRFYSLSFSSSAKYACMLCIFIYKKGKYLIKSKVTNIIWRSFCSFLLSGASGNYIHIYACICVSVSESTVFDKKKMLEQCSNSNDVGDDGLA